MHSGSWHARFSTGVKRATESPMPVTESVGHTASKVAEHGSPVLFLFRNAVEIWRCVRVCRVIGGPAPTANAAVEREKCLAALSVRQSVCLSVCHSQSSCWANECRRADPNGPLVPNERRHCISGQSVRPAPTKIITFNYFIIFRDIRLLSDRSPCIYSQLLQLGDALEDLAVDVPNAVLVEEPERPRRVSRAEREGENPFLHSRVTRAAKWTPRCCTYMYRSSDRPLNMPFCSRTRWLLFSSLKQEKPKLVTLPKDMDLTAGARRQNTE